MEDDIAERLSSIAEELGELAFERLREASTTAEDGGGPDPRLIEEERRLTRARRAVEKALSVLRGPGAERS